MKWVIGGLVLVAVGAVLRHILRLGARPARQMRGLVQLSPDREAVYRPMAQEVEAQAAILGVSLNDAFEERDAGRHQIAWRLVRLSVGEWERLAEIVAALLKVMAKHMADARELVPVHGIASHRFKSQAMIDYVRMHELLDQLVFRSKLHFQLHVRVLRRAVQTLSGEFHRAYRYADRTEDRPEELWSRLDLYFHDFDLVAKETLLAFRAFLICLPPAALSNLAPDLKSVVQRRVRSAPISANR